MFHKMAYPVAMPSGFLNVNKPPGPTSHDVVAAVRRRLPRRPKVGHAGTLDPFAEGVLVLCVGPATRLADYVQAAAKRYRATVRLGATSSTDDTEGEIAELRIADRGLRIGDTGAPSPDTSAIRATLARFVGEIEQVPPAFSAVHVDGRRAYELARRGRDVRLAPRKVTVHSVELLAYDWPRLEIDVLCGGGTYVRALARDIGAALGVGGYCARLIRTAVGAFTIDKAIVPDDLDVERDLLSPLTAVAHLPRWTADERQEHSLRNGNAIDLDTPPRAGAVAMLDGRGRLLGIGRIEPGGRRLYPRRVFPYDEAQGQTGH